MQIVRRIGVMSLGKLMGITYGCIGLLFMPFFLIAGGFTMLTADGAGKAGGVGTVVMALLFPFIYAFIGFVGGIFAAFIYNLASNFVGGIEIELGPVTPRVMTAAGGNSTMA